MILGAFRGGNPLERIVAISDKWSGKLPRNRLTRHLTAANFRECDFWAASLGVRPTLSFHRGATQLLQFCILSFGLLEDRDLWVPHVSTAPRNPDGRERMRGVTDYNWFSTFRGSDRFTATVSIRQRQGNHAQREVMRRRKSPSIMGRRRRNPVWASLTCSGIRLFFFACQPISFSMQAISKP